MLRKTLMMTALIAASILPCTGQSRNASHLRAGTDANTNGMQTQSTTLDGIYTSLVWNMGSARIRRLIFSPDGWVVKDIPQEGMIGFNFTAYRNDPGTSRQFVGRYQTDGNKVDIAWQDFRGPAFPSNHEVILRDEGSAHPRWDPSIDTFIPMCRCTGKTFSGKYIWGQVAADQYIEFNADGTFIDHRVTDQVLIPSPFYLHPRIQQGRYAIQSQTMIFVFADGHRGMRTFMAPKAQENDPKFEWIGLGWQQLYEEGYLAQLNTKQ